jgi:hypothetical protein
MLLVLTLVALMEHAQLEQIELGSTIPDSRFMSGYRD